MGEEQAQILLTVRAFAGEAPQGDDQTVVVLGAVKCGSDTVQGKREGISR